MKRLSCLFKGHVWLHPTKFPTHGYYDLPIKGAYCGRCGRKAV